ncbi:MAG: DUF5671 domain-containing protein [Candidatus Azambacteria bacterium]|nr:DUF5671 domain-containing protein [Candidatus Azambacteria bacterium]
MNDFKSPEIKNSMVEIFVNFLSFILLGIIATSIGILYFQVINKYFPDILSSTYQNYQMNNYNASGIRYSIASLFIGFPIYLWAMWFWFRSFKDLSQKVESKLSKWLTYIVLLIAGGTIIGDLIAVVYNFLQGEFGSRFLLKALTIIVIAGAVFGFYFLERKKIQYKKEIAANSFLFFGIFSGALIILAIILGFTVSGTPFEARLRNLDLRRTGDLQNLSSCVNSFSFDNQRLPENLNELKNGVQYTYCASKTIDSETQKEYEYRAVSSSEFELCGEFSLSTLDEFSDADYYGKWQKHGKGRVCEKQTVTFGKQPLPMEKPASLPIR